MNRALLGSFDLKLVYSYAITAFFLFMFGEKDEDEQRKKLLVRVA